MSDRIAARPSTPWWAGLRAYPFMAAAALVAAVAVGVAAVLLVPSSYTSQASVLVAPLLSGAEDRTVRSDQLVNMQTEAQILKSREVLSDAAARLETTPETLGRAVTVEVVPGTQVAVVTASAARPDSAQQRAGEVVTSYLDTRKTDGEALLEQQRTRLEAQLAALTDQIVAVSGQRAVVEEGSSEALLLDSQLNSLRESLAAQRSELYQVEGSVVDPGRIIAPASSGKSATPAAWMVLAAAAGVGVLLALGLTWYRLSRDPRARTWQQLSALGIEARSVPAQGDVELPHASLVSRHVHAGGSLLVMPVDADARPPYDVARRLVPALHLNGAAGRNPVVATWSPLAVEGQRRLSEGDPVVLVARQAQTRLSDVNDSLQTCAAANTQVVATLLVPVEEEQFEVVRIVTPELPASSADRPKDDEPA